MKVNVTMFGDANKQISDNELLVAKDFILQDITLWLRWCGVDKVVVTRPRPGVNLSNLQWSGITASEELPKLVMELRPYILLNVVKMLMDVCNISTVQIDLTPDEIKERANYWKSFDVVQVKVESPACAKP